MEVMFDPTHKTVVDEVLLPMPGVKSSRSWGYPSYKVNRKIFAFVGGKGMSIKLTEARVNELLGTHPHFHPFYPAEGMVWKGWLSIEPEDPAEYHQHEALFQEAMALVANG